MASNPLLDRRASQSSFYAGSIVVNGQTIPTDIEGYVAWLNSREPRQGRWVVVEKEGRKSFDFLTQTATTDFLREKGLVPKMQKVGR